MSIFSSIGGALKGALGGFLTGGPAGAIIGGAAGALGRGGGGGGRIPPRMPTTGGFIPGGRRLPSLPGAGALKIPPIQISKALPAIGKIGGGALAVKEVYDQFGNFVGYKPRRRRRKGISASELKGFKRVATILSQYQKVATAKHVKAPKRRARVCA